MDIVIMGVTFPDIDLTQADTVEAYEVGLKKLTNLKENARARTSAQFIRDLCDGVRGWLNGVLGDGAGEDVLPEDSMRDAFQAMRDLIQAEKAAKEEIDALWADFDSAQSEAKAPPRRERRAAQREATRRNRRGGRRESGAGAGVAADPYGPERVAT